MSKQTPERVTADAGLEWSIGRDGWHAASATTGK